jgi:hypothetical protein
MIFHLCRSGSSVTWIVLEGQPYGDYLDRDQAVMDAIDAAQEAREIGGAAEVWEGAIRVY